MKTVHLTVNGEASSATVSARTQLAEVLRDHLHLTGTHLGCEQGVCGACTVLADGRPIRSCITYAHACEGSDITTVEGLREDPVGRALRDAFARHHAVQCGFCTPGMLISAWDIVTRAAPSSEARIRHELSGNLCRCTGYMGIVAAVREVALRHRGDGSAGAGDSTAPEPVVPRRVAFAPFEVDPAFVETASTTITSRAGGAMTLVDGWSRVDRQFTIAHPLEALWSLFEDLPRVAQCIPGVRVESAGADRFSGTVAIHFGPISATFDGAGTRKVEREQMAGTISGTGRDPRGRTTLDAQLGYALSGPGAAHGPGASTRVELVIRFRLQGDLAQFNRPELVESFADVMLAEFVHNCERLLGGEDVRSGESMSGLALLWRMIKARLGRRKGSPQDRA